MLFAGMVESRSRFRAGMIVSPFFGKVDKKLWLSIFSNIVESTKCVNPFIPTMFAIESPHSRSLGIKIGRIAARQNISPFQFCKTHRSIKLFSITRSVFCIGFVRSGRIGYCLFILRQYSIQFNRILILRLIQCPNGFSYR